MPTRDGYPEGVPCWADLATTDVEAAKSFYSTLFAWEIKGPETDSIPYWTAYQKGRPAAGIGPTPQDQPYSVWSTHFAVDSVDASAQRIQDAGGQVLFGPEDILDSGRLALAADPTGAVFGIWQAREHTGAGIVNEHGALNWNELTCDDLESTLPFYEAVFGHTRQTGDMPDGRTYTTLKVGGRMIAGAMPPPAKGIPNSWGVYFAVDDVEKATATTTKNNGDVVYGPVDIPGVGTIVGLKDPTGAHFTAIQLTAEVD